MKTNTINTLCGQIQIDAINSGNARLNPYWGFNSKANLAAAEMTSAQRILLIEWNAVAPQFARIMAKTVFVD